MNRHLSRLIAMQTLYEWAFREATDLDEISSRNIEEYHDKCEKEFIEILVDGVSKNLDEIDKIIAESAPEWPLEQIPLIDKTILRLSVFELLKLNDIPPKVSINEAVELAKQFGGENSSKFINGVLGTVYKNHEKAITTKMEK